MAKKKGRTPTRKLFREPGQEEMFDKSVEEEVDESGVVECLGLSFPNEDARRAHFLGKLKEKLGDPAFRRLEGFPVGEDEDILRMSDPPYYTACPNPFLEDVIRVHGRPYKPEEKYHREPFAVDTSIGKTDQLYKAHGYHTKVPHLAIVPSILHYTKPGEIVLDGFCGSGMTGVAAQWCGAAPASYRRDVELRWKAEGRNVPEWGARHVILNDLGPAATFIAAGYNLPFHAAAFEKEARRILDEVQVELGWMYETRHKGDTKGRVNYTVWSEVFSCPECAGEVIFVDEALDEKSKRVKDEFPCPTCRAKVNKESLQQHFETVPDPADGTPWRRIKFVPVLINYHVGKKIFEKKPDDTDIDLFRRIARMPLPSEVPTKAFPLKEMYHGSRLGPKGFTRVHHLFAPRVHQVIGALWKKAVGIPDVDTRRLVFFLLEQAIWTSSRLNRFQPQGFKQVNKYLPGVYYVPSHHCEPSIEYAIGARGLRLGRTFAAFRAAAGSAWVSTGTCACLGLASGSVDYVFTDPPFGANIPYADLNFLVESWHRVYTDAKPEAIVDTARKKGLHEYQDLMRQCFEEYHRVLKPSRWMTVVFSNSSNAVWRTIQEALGRAGFVVADVRTLDKELGSYRQVTSSAVKQDLVISAYKPTEKLEQKFKLGSSSADGAWAFVREHLENVPVFVASKDKAEIVVERTAQMLNDRMIAYHVQRGLSVPLSASEFLAGLARFPQRHGMFFLPEQVAEFDKKRAAIDSIGQIELSVNSEASAIMWLRAELEEKPRTFQDLTPVFTRELQAWARHERTVELKEILHQNFLMYDGKGPVPAQIHSYLSSNFKELRNLDKNDPGLKEKALDRWYVPDPAKQGDLEKVREHALLKEFESYRDSKERSLKSFRTEAIRAGFKAAYDAQDYKTIIAVASKLPESVLQEDDKLVMYFDVASMRLGAP